jgi:hypothetical protein
MDVVVRALLAAVWKTVFVNKKKIIIFCHCKMSNLEVAKVSSTYNFACTAMTAGVIAQVMPSSFFPGVSRILGVVRTTAGGTVGQPYVRSVVGPAAGASAATITLHSASALDTSVYTIFWVSETVPSNSTILSC